MVANVRRDRNSWATGVNQMFRPLAYLMVVVGALAMLVGLLTGDGGGVLLGFVGGGVLCLFSAMVLQLENIHDELWKMNQRSDESPPAPPESRKPPVGRTPPKYQPDQYTPFPE